MRRQAVGVARLAGGPSDAEMLGELVWAPGYQGMRWPGEMLDPFRLPPSRSLPVRALQGAPAPAHAFQGAPAPAQTHRVGVGF